MGLSLRGGTPTWQSRSIFNYRDLFFSGLPRNLRVLKLLAETNTNKGHNRGLTRSYTEGINKNS
ncbi:MAG: hypothetical protein UR66_C0016G0011 [Candidatus Moranbacteria bacterium GW2011_GWE1_35_17]|nr:MAG: hypothetical protein UR66_C0016G0011 [Candidatus Moranbacteria bacterium GW2011_GWE1_35_17]KKP82492.1 MAG: hypothetical protein UR82_C0038G0018 [Candidatus Moranbacteria bacterium GW2011_GWF1_35_5]